MKITHICLNGPFTDGWNYQENVLTKYHKQLGLDVTVIASKWQWNSHGDLEICERTDYQNCNSVYIVRLPVRGKKSFGSRFKYFDGLYTAVENSEPDILFIHGVSFCDVSTLACYLKNHPRVVAYADNHADFPTALRLGFLKPYCTKQSGGTMHRNLCLILKDSTAYCLLEWIFLKMYIIYLRSNVSSW